MYIRQSKNSFIRTTKLYGYITNQLTRHDRCYDEFGADILREITRFPREIDEIVRHLLTIYEGVDFEVRYQGTYEECTREMKKEIKELVDNYELADEDICDNVIDTGNEWEVFDIVKIEEA